MENIYLIASDDSFLINNKIKQLFKDKSGREFVHYDLKEVSIDRVIEDLDTLNLFTNEKIIIAENAYFLTSEKPKNVIEQDTKSLEKYLSNPSSNNILILICSKLDERKSLVKLLKKQVKIIEVTTDINKFVDKKLDGYSIKEEDKKYLLERTLNNFEKVNNEIEKLKLYKYDEKEITKKDIEELVTKTIDDNIFTLIDAIIRKDKKLAFEIYQDLILHNEEPTKILILLANRFRLLYQVKILSKTIYRDDEIGRIIGSHPYPVKLARGMINKFKEKDLLSYLDKLANIDINIKTGKTYKNIALETFILTL